MDVPKVANNLRITAELHQDFKAKLYIFSVYIYKKRFKAILTIAPQNNNINNNNNNNDNNNNNNDKTQKG